MKKLFTLLTLALLWAANGVANIYVSGDFNGWDAASGAAEMQYFSDHAEKKIYFEAGKTYKFKIVDNGNWLGDLNGGTMKRGASSGWYFGQKGYDTYFDTDIAGEYTFTYYWNDEGEGSVSIIYPARTQDITLTTVNTGYYAASYCPADYNVTVPEGVTVWRIGSTPTAEGNYTAYNVSKEHTGETIVLGNETGVLLISEEGNTFTFTETSETATELGDNNLKGAFEEVTSAGDYLAFFVATATPKNYVAFAKVASGVTIPKGKAYMDAPAASSEVRIMFDGMTTGVNRIEGAAQGTMHNLLGMPVGANYRGIVVRDGKKFVNR